MIVRTRHPSLYKHIKLDHYVFVNRIHEGKQREERERKRERIVSTRLPSSLETTVAVEVLT